MEKSIRVEREYLLIRDHKVLNHLKPNKMLNKDLKQPRLEYKNKIKLRMKKMKDLNNLILKNCNL